MDEAFHGNYRHYSGRVLLNFGAALDRLNDGVHVAFVNCRLNLQSTDAALSEGCGSVSEGLSSLAAALTPHFTQCQMAEPDPGEGRLHLSPVSDSGHAKADEGSCCWREWI